MSKNKYKTPVSSSLGKLSQLEEVGQERAAHKVKKNKKAITVKTFRLRPADVDSFSLTKEKINTNELSRKEFSDSEVLRGLVFFAIDKGSAKEIIKYIEKHL